MRQHARIERYAYVFHAHIVCPADLAALHRILGRRIWVHQT
jgi:hypothetical protein